MKSILVLLFAIVFTSAMAVAAPIAVTDIIDSADWSADDRQQLNPERTRRQLANNNKNTVNVGVDHSRQGTNVAVDAQRRLWESQNRRSSLDGQANYNQHFGGPAGRQRPNYGVGLMFRHRFWLWFIIDRRVRFLFILRQIISQIKGKSSEEIVRCSYFNPTWIHVCSRTIRAIFRIAYLLHICHQ